MSKDDVSWDVICNDGCGVLEEEWRVLAAEKLAKDHRSLYNHEVTVTRSNNREKQ